MSNTYVPAQWVGFILIVGAALNLALLISIAFLKMAMIDLEAKCKQYKASVQVNQNNLGSLVLAVKKRDDTIRKLELDAIRHVSQIESAETRIVKEVNKQKALHHEIDNLKTAIAACRTMSGSNR